MKNTIQKFLFISLVTISLYVSTKVKADTTGKDSTAETRF